MFEFLESAAPFFGDIGGEFHAIQTEMRTAQQSQFFTHQQNIAEDALDFLLHRRDKMRHGAVIRGVAAGKRHEDDVFLASSLDLSGTDHASGVGKQNDFEQDLGVDGSCAGYVVFVAPFKHRQIDMLLHQFVDRVLQCSRDKLVLQGDGEHDQLISIAWFEFCHRFLYLIEPLVLVDKVMSV